MKTTIALYNSLCTTELLDKLKIKYTFIGYGYFTGALYVYYNDYYALPYKSPVKNHRGFNKVFCKIYIIDDLYYMKQLDAYMRCSKSMLKKNHDIMDLTHRTKMKVTPIFFTNISDFIHLNYKEGDEVEIETYIGNINNSRVVSMINKNNKHRCESPSHYIIEEVYNEYK